LRERGYVAAVDVRGRSVASNLRDGARRGLSAIVVVGAEEQSRGGVRWRDLAAREERWVVLDEIPGLAGGA
jgi:histidyl-tRNA synthetase